MSDFIERLITLAIDEDLGDGDHTSLATIPENAQGKANLLVKQHGILAGVAIGQRVFHRIDPFLKLDIFIQDGARISPDDIVFTVSGKVQSILSAERLVLNIMQRMSGIATQTSRYVKLLEGLETKVLDTRKTTPGMRLLDKEAIRIGGGQNHRIGLYDMIMIKDNHVDFAGGIVQAIKATHSYLSAKKKDLKIEIEVRDFEELQQVIDYGGVQRVMFDNFGIANTVKAVKMIDKRFETESSGGITIENLRSYAECGVDYISVGALTHQIRSIDLSLKADF